MIDLNRPTTVLLGAGASKEAGMPLATELTEQLLEYFANRDGWDFGLDTSQALRAVVHELARAQGGDVRSVPVEEMFSAISLLNARHTDLEVAPLVDKWVRRVIERDVKGGESGLPALVRVENGMTDALSELLRPQSDRLAFLAPLFALPEPVRIATLNYDLSIEEASRLAELACATGAGFWCTDGTGWRWPGASSVQLLKLHGSLTWFESAPGEDPEAPMQRSIIEHEEFLFDPSHTAGGQTLLVFGRRDKLRATGPSLDLLGEWRTWLASAEQVLVVGYSFTDPHINECIRGWWCGHPNGQLWVVDPGMSEDETLLPPFLREAKAADSQGRLHLVRLSAGDGLASLLGPGKPWATPTEDRWGIPLP